LRGGSAESWITTRRTFPTGSSFGSADGPLDSAWRLDPADYGRSAAHTREQVRAFRASPELLLKYHDAAYERLKRYIETLTAEDLARQLDEPQHQPLPTVAIRLVSVLENAMNNQGQISYLKAYHRLGGWFPRESKDPASFR
jgi:hypothetical protein